MNDKCVFNHGKDCAALKEVNREKCRFFKTPEQHAESRKRARQRINSLPDLQQEYIKTKYH